MKRFLLLLISLTSLISLITPTLISAQETTRLIVKYRSSLEPVHDRLESRLRLRSLRLRAPRTRILSLENSRKTEIIASLQQSGLVEYIEEDQPLEALEIPNDPQYNQQWALTKINAPAAWEISKSGANTQIAILDSGVTKSHADLQGKVILEANFSDDTTVEDRFGHGTHVAGIAAAATNNSTGIAGIGQESQIMSGKVLNRYGRGYYSWLVNALYWAADSGAEVINMSIGGSTGSQALQDAVDYAWNKGVVLVAAAGNSHSQSLVYPASYSHVIAVAATDKTDQKAYFSNYGSWVDLAAPGVSILSLDDNGGYITQTGTSMAAPHVSGVAALLWGTTWGTNNQSVVDRLYTTAIPVSGTSKYWQHGRVDAAAALGTTAMPNPSPTPTSTPTPIPTAVPILTPQNPDQPKKASPSPFPSRLCQRIPSSRRCR